VYVDIFFAVYNYNFAAVGTAYTCYAYTSTFTSWLSNSFIN